MGLSSVLTLALVVQSSGCSFMFVHGPPEHHAEMPTFDCSDGAGWPVFDVIWAALNGIGAASAAGSEEMNEMNEGASRGQVIGVGLAWLVISGASAIYGFGKVGECRNAKQQLAERNYNPGSPATVSPVPAPGRPRPAGAPAASGVAPKRATAVSPPLPATPSSPAEPPASGVAPGSTAPASTPASAPPPAPGDSSTQPAPPSTPPQPVPPHTTSLAPKMLRAGTDAQLLLQTARPARARSLAMRRAAAE